MVCSQKNQEGIAAESAARSAELAAESAAESAAELAAWSVWSAEKKWQNKILLKLIRKEAGK